MVDDCIKIERKREDGKVERFSKPKDVVMLGDKIGGKKRFDRVKAIFPTAETYCEKCSSKPENITNLFLGKPSIETENKQNTKRKKEAEPKLQKP